MHSRHVAIILLLIDELHKQLKTRLLFGMSFVEHFSQQKIVLLKAN